MVVQQEMTVKVYHWKIEEAEGPVDDVPLFILESIFINGLKEEMPMEVRVIKSNSKSGEALLRGL